jgi:site-specific recombinase XerD
MSYELATADAELYEEFLAAAKRRVTSQGFVSLAGRVKRLVQWFEDEELELVEVGIREALRYQSYLAEHRDESGMLYTTGTMHNYLKAARSFFEYLKQTERIAENPFMELRYPRMSEHLSRNVLSEAQMGALLGELMRFDELPVWWMRERRYRVHVLAEVLYATGLRISEACSLVDSDFDLEHRLIFLREGKGEKPRVAYLTEYATAVVSRYIETGRAATRHEYARSLGDRTFGANSGRVMSVMNRELESVCVGLGIPVITSHGFRHSLGTHLLRSGVDMRHIQAILGHEALQTTQVYTHVDKEDLKKSLDAHHPRQWDVRA